MSNFVFICRNSWRFFVDCSCLTTCRCCGCGFLPQATGFALCAVASGDAPLAELMLSCLTALGGALDAATVSWLMAWTTTHSSGCGCCGCCCCCCCCCSFDGKPRHESHPAMSHSAASCFFFFFGSYGFSLVAFVITWAMQETGCLGL